jgi:hypothetical protein
MLIYVYALECILGLVKKNRVLHFLRQLAMTLEDPFMASDQYWYFSFALSPERKKHRFPKPVWNLKLIDRYFRMSKCPRGEYFIPDKFRGQEFFAKFCEKEGIPHYGALAFVKQGRVQNLKEFPKNDLFVKPVYSWMSRGATPVSFDPKSACYLFGEPIDKFPCPNRIDLPNRPLEKEKLLDALIDVNLKSGLDLILQKKYENSDFMDKLTGGHKDVIGVRSHSLLVGSRHKVSAIFMTFPIGYVPGFPTYIHASFSPDGKFLKAWQPYFSLEKNFDHHPKSNIPFKSLEENFPFKELLKMSERAHMALAKRLSRELGYNYCCYNFDIGWTKDGLLFQEANLVGFLEGFGMFGDDYVNNFFSELDDAIRINEIDAGK